MDSATGRGGHIFHLLSLDRGQRLITVLKLLGWKQGATCPTGTNTKSAKNMANHEATRTFVYTVEYLVKGESLCECRQKQRKPHVSLCSTIIQLWIEDIFHALRHTLATYS